MRYFPYETFVLQRSADDRVFLVNPRMKFEYFLYCFQTENPMFIVSELEDGRVAIVPNALCVPWNHLESGFWPEGLLPDSVEYVTMKHGTYPVIISAHPINNFRTWFKSFLGCAEQFAKQSLWEFIDSSRDFRPVRFENVREEARFTTAAGI